MFPVDQTIDFSGKIVATPAFLDSLGLSPHKHRAVRAFAGSLARVFVASSH
jgi:hypothetical protein